MTRNFALAALAGLAFSGQVNAQDECSLRIEGNDQIEFNKEELTVSASCSEVTLTLVHVGELEANVMGHNWALSTQADWEQLAMDGQAAGAPDYLPEDDDRVIAATDVIGGGEQTTITFDISGLDPGGSYMFFCSFPGHYSLMNGEFIIE